MHIICLHHGNLTAVAVAYIQAHNCALQRIASADTAERINHHTTRGRLEAMIDYIEANFAGYAEIDRQLILIAPSAFAEDPEQQREIGNSSMASFTRLITAGLELGDVKTTFSPEILAATVVGTLNMLSTSWAMDSSYPVFAKLEEARALFEHLICKDNT